MTFKKVMQFVSSGKLRKKLLEADVLITSFLSLFASRFSTLKYISPFRTH